MPTAVDPQESHQGSAGANVVPDDARNEAEPATEHPHSTNPDLANSSGLDQVEPADNHDSVARKMSSLTPAESPPASAAGDNVINNPNIQLPSAFSSNNNRRRRVQGDKPIEEERGWREPPPIPNPGSDTINNTEDEPQNDRPLELEAIPEADNAADSEFGIAEFESNRPSSPEDDDTGIDQNKLVDRPSNLPDYSQNPGNDLYEPSVASDDDQSEKSHDTELDTDILNNNQVAYNLARDNNGPWNPPSEDEQSAQLFLDGLTDHQRAVTRVLAHRQV